MANSKHVVYKSDGPHMKGAVRVGAGQGPGGSSAGQPPLAAGNGTSPVPVGAGGNVSQSSQLGNAVVGSMPTINQINVLVNRIRNMKLLSLQKAGRKHSHMNQLAWDLDK